MATIDQKELPASLLNKVVKEAVRRELAIAGHGDAKCVIGKVVRTDGHVDGSNWNVRVVAGLAIWMIAKAVVDDTRRRYTLQGKVVHGSTRPIVRRAMRKVMLQQDSSAMP
jgi:hypothetical protein